MADSHAEALRIAAMVTGAALARAIPVAGTRIDNEESRPYSVAMTENDDALYSCPGCGEGDPYRCECNAPCPRGLDGERVCCGCPQACAGARSGRSLLIDEESV